MCGQFSFEKLILTCSFEFYCGNKERDKIEHGWVWKRESAHLGYLTPESTRLRSYWHKNYFLFIKSYLQPTEYNKSISVELPDFQLYFLKPFLCLNKCFYIEKKFISIFFLLILSKQRFLFEINVIINNFFFLIQ